MTAYGEERRKRHPLRNTIIVLVILAVLLGTLYYVANNLARQFATSFVQSGVAQELGGSSGDVHVDLGKGSILLQLAQKHIKTMHVTIDHFTSGDLAGDAAFDATGVPLNTTDPTSTIDITVAVGASGIVGVVDAAAGGKASAGLHGNLLRITTSEKLLGRSKQVSVDYIPSTSGDTTLVLTPADIVIGSKQYTPAQFTKSVYAHTASRLAKPRMQCLATSLPKSMKLTGIAVSNQKLVVAASGTGLPLGGLSTKGTCPAS